MSTQLILPSTIKPSPNWRKRAGQFAMRLSKNGRSVWRQTKPKNAPREHPGRRIGKPEGTYIMDLVALRKAILLCWRCQPRFNHKRANYYKDERFPYVVGRCDGCRRFMSHQAKLYIHESFLGDPGGRLRAGQCWTPL
ncbi:hypothetical protein AMJ82_08925 [candidate division TA06 bacterium SM23_40]|uniref:Uncharacterized protein n=1 Tax=candidate division TA06 bacterium SM23_40 TaxID=1703774 RepID=A0A0S8G5A7_UNCT6|nr:MAG: hypothetical protein AMJ82_08925 [candidate division TA06 bacterium SM23_40]